MSPMHSRMMLFALLLSAIVQGCACNQPAVVSTTPKPPDTEPAPPPVAVARPEAPPRPTRDYNIPTNAEMLQTTAMKAARQIAAAPAMFGATRVAVASLERIAVRDVPVQCLVEDAILEALDLAGIRTLERDPDIMLRLMFQEGTPSIEYMLMPHQNVEALWLKETVSPAITRHPDSTVTMERVQRPGHELLEAHTFDYSQPLHILDPRIDGRRLARLDTAEYIVGYRVLEHGVQYRESENCPVWEPKFKRHALTRVHARIVNAKTGAVLWARTVDGVEDDEIQQMQRGFVETPGFAGYYPTYPMQEQ